MNRIAHGSLPFEYAKFNIEERIRGGEKVPYFKFVDVKFTRDWGIFKINAFERVLYLDPLTLQVLDVADRSQALCAYPLDTDAFNNGDRIAPVTGQEIGLFCEVAEKKLDNGINTVVKKVYCFDGEPGLGKTTFLMALRKKKDHSKVATCHVRYDTRFGQLVGPWLFREYDSPGKDKSKETKRTYEGYQQLPKKQVHTLVQAQLSIFEEYIGEVLFIDRSPITNLVLMKRRHDLSLEQEDKEAIADFYRDFEFSLKVLKLWIRQLENSGVHILWVISEEYAKTLAGIEENIFSLIKNYTLINEDCLKDYADLFCRDSIGKDYILDYSGITLGENNEN